jgi:hypothetical protein
VWGETSTEGSNPSLSAIFPGRFRLGPDFSKDRLPNRHLGDKLETLRLEHFLIIGGFALLLLNSLGRRRGRGRPAAGAPKGAFSWWLRYGDFIALGMVGAGLVALMLQK